MKGIVEDRKFGFRRLDPVPEESHLKEFYESQYYASLRKGQRGQDLCRLMKGGPEGDSERAWLCSTLYSDVAALLEDKGRRKKGPRFLLDIGSGTGEFLQFMASKGWKTEGLELSSDARALAQEKGLKVHGLPAERFLAQEPARRGRFQAITLFHVLEHLLDPVGLLRTAKKLLAPGGILVVQVPNDFNALQLTVTKKSGQKPWWVVSPDHINYFDFEALRRVLRGLGFEVLHTQGDFPMEIFLLMGRETDYVGNPEIGNICHQRRIRFETSLSPEVRRKLYHSFGTAGLGRNCLVLARRK